MSQLPQINNVSRPKKCALCFFDNLKPLAFCWGVINLTRIKSNQIFVTQVEPI